MLCLALLTCLLTMSTFVHLSEGAFVAYTIGTGIVLAAAGAYLQTSVLAIASLFGPTVLQSLMSGQALVAVILSTLQLISATSSLHTSNAANAGPADGVAETKSARLFFGIAALFLFLCGVANAWMTRLPSFRAVVPIDEGEPWMRRRLSISADIRSPVIGGPHKSASDSKALWDRILGIAHRNITYEFAIAYVLMVTLVSSYHNSYSEAEVDGYDVSYSLSIPPSRYRLFPPIPRHTHCYSARSISSCSI
jgi:equilibrative nucleoside transporter 1/2/3